MERELKIKTSFKDDEEEEVEPVSPSGYYFNSSVLSLTILAVLEAEAPIDDSQTMQLLRDVFLPINPRFSSIMVNGASNKKQWKKVEVNLKDHIKVPIFSPNLQLERYDDQFDEYLTKIAMDPLPQHKPLWEIHIVKYPTSKAAGNIIFKLHHALGDGYSLMGALLSCLQRADDSSTSLTFPAYRKEENRRVGYFQRVSKALYVAYNTLCEYASSILKSSVIVDDKTPIRSGNEDVEHKPISISTIELSLHKCKEIKNELGVTINDVLASIVFYGARLYMQEKNRKWGSSNSNMLVLMNTRSVNGYKSVSEMLMSPNKLWGNQFAFLHAPIPQISNNVELHDPLKMVFHSKRIIQTKKYSLAHKLTAHTLEAIRKCLGPEVVAGFLHNTIRNASIVMSNMVGPIEKMTISNQPIKGLYFVVCGSPQSVGIQVLSYMETLRISIAVEKDFINLQDFKSCIEKAFLKTIDAATKKGR